MMMMVMMMMMMMMMDQNVPLTLAFNDRLYKSKNSVINK